MKVTVRGGAKELYSGDSYLEAKECLMSHFSVNFKDSPVLEDEVCVDVKTDIDVYLIQNNDGAWETYIIETTYS